MRPAVALLAVLLAVSASPANAHARVQHVSFMDEQDTSIEAVRLELEKLRALLAEAQKVDDLEKAGLSPEDARLMRRALEEKIRSMIQRIVRDIQNL